MTLPCTGPHTVTLCHLRDACKCYYFRAVAKCFCSAEHSGIMANSAVGAGDAACPPAVQDALRCLDHCCRYDDKKTAYLPFNKAWVKERVLKQLKRQAGLR